MTEQSQLPQTYPQKDVSFETVKGASLGGLLSGGVVLALTGAMNISNKKPFTSPPLLALCAAVGAGMALYTGVSANISTRVLNQRRDALNKFSDHPEVQDAIRKEVGSVDRFDQKSGKVEGFAFGLSVVSLATSLLASKVLKKPELARLASNTMGASFALSVAAGAVHSFHVPALERKRLSFVDRISADRAIDQQSSVTAGTSR
jgi:hypothetical protein